MIQIQQSHTTVYSVPREGGPNSADRVLDVDRHYDGTVNGYAIWARSRKVGEQKLIFLSPPEFSDLCAAIDLYRTSGPRDSDAVAIEPPILRLVS